MIELFTAVAAAVGALAGIWNGYQFAILKGRVDEQGSNLTAHVNAAGLHGSR